MKVFLAAIFVAYLSSQAAAQEKGFRIDNLGGDIRYRTAFATEWIIIQKNTILQEHDMIRSGPGASANIHGPDNAIFRFPEMAQIEMRELLPMTRNELVMALTALEILELPGKAEKPQNQSAFILHGKRLSDSIHTEKGFFEYVKLEENGALALFEQRFLSGFIFKCNKLKRLYPEFQLKDLQLALIKAYDEMEMPFRKEKELQDFNTRWPEAR